MIALKYLAYGTPVAHHGQYQGKEGQPTLVVEAMVGHSLYAWHAVFGYCRMLNDITIWDNSLLLQAMCDGSFEEINFPSQWILGHRGLELILHCYMLTWKKAML